MIKVDYKKQLKDCYNPTSKDVTLIDIPEMNFITIEGEGAPESIQFKEAVEALFPIAYGIKFYYKKSEGIDYGVMPLEGLWWAEDMVVFNPETTNKNKWKWILMIMQPEFVKESVFEKIKNTVISKKSNLSIERVMFERFKEGKSAQIMHIGPFSKEGPNIKRIHEKIEEISGERDGKHHEIYISDFRRVNPGNMKTVLRQPYITY